MVKLKNKPAANRSNDYINEGGRVGYFTEKLEVCRSTSESSILLPNMNHTDLLSADAEVTIP